MARKPRFGVDFGQPSTWRAIALLMPLITGATLSPHEIEIFTAVGVAASGLIGLFVVDRSDDQ